jgi:hypothetical protein
MREQLDALPTAQNISLSLYSLIPLSPYPHSAFGTLFWALPREPLSSAFELDQPSSLCRSLVSSGSVLFDIVVSVPSGVLCKP